MSFIKNFAGNPRSICNKNKHVRLYRDNQFVFLMKIMNIFEMILSVVIILSMKYIYKIIINNNCI